MSITEDVKVHTDGIRTKVYGREVRSDIADGIDEIAEVVQNAVVDQITDYDSFFLAKRKPNSGGANYDISPGGLHPDTGAESASDTVARSPLISLYTNYFVRLTNNMDNKYQISSIWTYYNDGGTRSPVEKIYTAENNDKPAMLENGILVRLLSDRNEFRVTFKKTAEYAATTGTNTISPTERTEISSMFEVLKVTDSELQTENVPADAAAVNALIFAGRDKTKNTARVLTWFSDPSSMETLSEMPNWSIAVMSGKNWKDKFFGDDFPNRDKVTDAISYVMQKEAYGTGSALYHRYTFSPLGGGRTWTGYTTIPNPNTITWTNTFEPNVSVQLLVFGSSFSYSTLGLLPAILKELGVSVTLGILYFSGGAINEHIDRFDNQTNYSVYSECNGSIWINTENSVTAQEALDRHKWDYIVMQGGGNGAGMETLIERIIGYINYPTSFLINIPQSYGPGTDYVFPTEGKTREEQSNNQFLQFAQTAHDLIYGNKDNDVTGHYTLDVIPSGTAVQNARQLEVFKAIGESEDHFYGYLCYDNYSHLQNGIGTLIPSYAAALKICELIGFKQKVFNIKLNPTDAWLASYGLYTRSSHGNSVGADDPTNKLLAQKCALQAVRHPFEITNLLDTM